MAAADSSEQTIRKQTIRMRQASFAWMVYFFLSGTTMGAAWLGIGPWSGAVAFSAASLLGQGLFCLAIRSGWNLRHDHDPSLTFSQCVYAAGCSSVAYFNFSQIGSAALLMTGLAITFGAFDLPRRRVYQLAIVCVSLNAIAILLLVVTGRAYGSDRAEIVEFVSLCIFAAGVAVVAGRVSEMRAELKSRAAELKVALAQNVELSTIDHLTQLYNRRYMSKVLAAACELAPPKGSTVAIVDLDHFKRFNDSYGHAVGDEVLRRFADCCLKTMRHGDSVARWGGEEFLFLFLDSAEQEAKAVLDRILVMWRATRIDVAPDHAELSFSAGVSVLHCGRPPAEAVALADEALYVAKASGRGCTVLASSLKAGTLSDRPEVKGT